MIILNAIQVSPIFIYILAPIIVLLFGVIITQFIRKYNKIDTLEFGVSKLLTKIEVLITRLDNHLETHSQTSQQEVYRRGICNKSFERVHNDIQKLNDKIDLSVQKLNDRIDGR